MENLVQTLLDETMLWAPRITGIVVIVIGFYVIAKVVNRVIHKAVVRLNFDHHLASFLARISSTTFIILGVITALGTLGINVSALVAGLGLTGFALGFALKDIISNLLSGVLILLYQPFKVGDTIIVSGYKGNVVSIDLRYTKLNSEGNSILMPNSKLFTDPITVLQPGDNTSLESKQSE